MQPMTSRRRAQRFEMDLEGAIVALVLELRRYAAQRFVMLDDRSCVRVLTFQIFVDGFAERFVVANFCATQARAEARRDAEIFVSRPDHHRHLVDQQFEMRFVRGFDRVRRHARSVFDDRDDVTVIIPNRCVRQANENLRAVLLETRRSFVVREFARDRCAEDALKRGCVTDGQQARERLADDFGFGVTV